MQIIAIVVSLAIAAYGITVFVQAIRQMVGVISVGQPLSRTDDPVGRSVTLLKESLGHTRMLQWTRVGAAHWFVMVGFGLLFFTLLTAFGQLFSPRFALPLIGHFVLWEWATELVTWVMIAAIIGFLVYRATRPTERVRGERGRLWGSTMWQGYFVEAVILGVGICIIALRGLEYALADLEGEDLASALHFPLTFGLGEAFSTLSLGAVENLIFLFAMLKIVISMTWMIVVARNLTMGVAWHRFAAFVNIWFKRESSGRTALGAVKPLTSAGEPVSLDDVEDLDEDVTLGVGAVEDFSWKGILDFTSCTECGRCQSQCPAWNTEKPLSPKLLITALRDHAYAKAPYLQADEADREALLAGSDTLTREVERPLVGDTGDDWFYNPESGAAVIDPEVLWNCTSCGACVQQCPVDIEHVDHIIDMRRYAVLVESNFPAELNGLFKGLESKGNPWNMAASARLDWATGLDFPVRVVGEDIADLDEVEWLFWVGCAGAYEDRAKKTTRAVAELLDLAGVSFGVLGSGETCTGDPARRAGNEFVFQGLAAQNVATMTEAKAKKVVSTCAHCFNTLKNEYSDLGIELEVVHHTQLLNRLVREGRLTPVAEGAGAAKRSITYHDPCYIGRHNGVYSPPRELLQVLPGAEVVEMERNSERSFCCGAGGARMWMEEKTGERINANRTAEAVGTGADQIAVGCPFCRVMLSDGLTNAQAKGEAREEVEVLDVAQMLLASVKGEQATKLAPGASGSTSGRDEEVAAEPEADDTTQRVDPENTVTQTAEAGPLAKASGGTSLFDTDADTADELDAEDRAETASAAETTPQEARAAEPASSGGSLFDVEEGEPGPAPTEPAPSPEPSAASETSTAAATTAPAATATEPAPVARAASTSSPSMFDIASADPRPMPKAAAAPEPTAEPEPDPAAEPAPASRRRSMFDIAAPAATATTTAAPVAPEPETRAEPAPEVTPEPTPEPEARASSEPAEETAEPAASTEAPATAAPAAPATSTTSVRVHVPGTEIPEGGSLFDIAEPEERVVERTAASAPAAPTPSDTPTQAPAEARTEEVPRPEPTPDPTPEPAPAAEPDVEVTADPDVEVESDGETEPAEDHATTPAPPAASTAPASTAPAASTASAATPAPTAGSGEAHQPRTDVDIASVDSLFDL